MIDKLKYHDCANKFLHFDIFSSYPRHSALFKPIFPHCLKIFPFFNLNRRKGKKNYHLTRKEISTNLIVLVVQV